VTSWHSAFDETALPTGAPNAQQGIGTVLPSGAPRNEPWKPLAIIDQRDLLSMQRTSLVGRLSTAEGSTLPSFIQERKTEQKGGNGLSFLIMINGAEK
jgi:hypothetical protein